jgi:hypothetical protein
VTDRWLRVVRSLCDAVAVGASLYLIAGKFPTDVMFADTVTNGGDMGTPYYAGVPRRPRCEGRRHRLVSGNCRGFRCSSSTSSSCSS